jgi:phosphoesterase RecJ-like protein
LEPTNEWAAAERVLLSLSVDARVLLTCHKNPDGDALGSMLGFALGLRQLGFRDLTASFPGLFELPDTLRELPGLEFLFGSEEIADSHDLVLAFDAASVERLGELAVAFRAAPVTIVLDHHASNTRFGEINLVDPAAAATAVVVDQFLTRLGVTLDARIAECLYVALATDTGSFRFSCTPAVHELAARLIATGIQTDEISRRLFESRPFGAVRLFADVLARAVLEPDQAGGHGLVWTYVTLDDLAAYRQRPQVLEALIDPVRCAEEADVACVLKEVDHGEWSVSLRSKGRIDVSEVAVVLGGGGHRSAAGFTRRGTVEDVIAAIRVELPGRPAGDRQLGFGP